MTSRLDALLIQRIRNSGPVPVDQFMTLALAHPEYGYYRTRDPLGRRDGKTGEAGGDFTTAPEISQMFGELIGLCFAVTWQQMGAPGQIRLVELGPGRGTLMADLWRAAAIMPDFRAALSVHLVETSPVLRAKQAETLTGLPVCWHDDFAEIPPGPMLLVANEFLDALPIRQFIRTADGWRERCVGLDEAGAMTFVAGAAVEPVEIPPAKRHAPIGAIAESSPAMLSASRAIADRIAGQGGMALLIDYGYAVSAAGDTLQAVRDHHFHPLLADVGEADVTAHVDFAEIARAMAAKTAVFGPVEQGLWLRKLGIEQRAAALSAARPDLASQLACDVERLINHKKMGTLFKVLCTAQRGLPAPPGLEQGQDFLS